MIRTESEESYVLDTSACLAFLEDEDGADTVEEILRTKKCLLPSVVLLEVYYITFRKKGEEIADKRYAMLKSLNVEFLWEIDESILITAGRFKGQYRLSLADAIIAAFTKREGAVLVHKDPEYDHLAHEIPLLALPRQ